MSKLATYHGIAVVSLVIISSLALIEASRCGPGEFSCGRRGQCIPNDWRCDGDFDCNNRKDEKGCGDLACDEHEHPCNDPHHRRCIPVYWRCDGDADCDDRSDEDPALCARPRP